MSRLKKWHGWTFKYDDDGNLIEKYKGGRGWFSAKEECWQYKWDAFGMLKEIKRPDKQKVTFTYDALGRRLTKHFSRTTTHFLWSGNVPLHEWKETFEFNYSTGLYDLGTEHSPTTWIFEAGSFVPCGKIANGKHYSIITDHLGTPIEAYNQEGELIWEREQDLYGNSRQGFAKENFRCPFKYQGQYYDSEVELCYNRFRYYHPETGRYISEDPIKLLGGFNIFAYVSDTNWWLDVLGLVSLSYSPAKYKQEWDKARKSYWLEQLERNPNRFSKKNKERIEKGLSPQIEIEIEHKATGKTMVVSVSMELEHTYLKQRGKSFKAHEFWNLTEATPWGHASMDKYRHISKKYKIIKVIKGMSTF